MLQGSSYFFGQLFEFSGEEIPFAELDVIHASAAGFGDFLEKALPARVLVAEELSAVSDVVEQWSWRHQLEDT